MGTAGGLLAEARKSLGMGEPNAIQAWYRSRNGSDYGGNFAWCDAAVTYWARHSDNAAAVLPAGDRAYTVYHAQDFQKIGRWFPGTAANLDKAKPGDIVFFDWGETNSIGAIDHVGVIEKVLGGGRVQTIEGNTADQCLRRVRGADVVAGFGRPAYDAVSAPKPAEPAATTPPWPGRLLENRSPMMHGPDVLAWQRQIRARGWTITTDGYYGPVSADTCRAFQREKHLQVDGIVGPATWKATWEAPVT